MNNLKFYFITLSIGILGFVMLGLSMHNGRGSSGIIEMSIVTSIIPMILISAIITTARYFYIKYNYIALKIILIIISTGLILFLSVATFIGLLFI